jgi:hypothetical protein
MNKGEKKESASRADTGRKKKDRRSKADTWTDGSGGKATLLALLGLGSRGLGGGGVGLFLLLLLLCLLLLLGLLLLCLLLLLSLLLLGVLLGLLLGLLLLLLVVLGSTTGSHMGLAKGGTESGVLYAQLIDESATLFPAAGGLIGRGKGGIEKSRSLLEGLDVLVSALAEGALGLAVLFCALCGGQSALGAAGWGRLWGGGGWGLAGGLLLGCLLLVGVLGGEGLLHDLIERGRLLGHATGGVVAGDVGIAWWDGAAWEVLHEGMGWGKDVRRGRRELLLLLRLGLLGWLLGLLLLGLGGGRLVVVVSLSLLALLGCYLGRVVAETHGLDVLGGIRGGVGEG